MSSLKSWWPGVSSRLMARPRYSNCMAALVTLMPRSCSMLIQSEWAAAPPSLAFTDPARSMAPP